MPLIPENLSPSVTNRIGNVSIEYSHLLLHINVECLHLSTFTIIT